MLLVEPPLLDGSKGKGQTKNSLLSSSCVGCGADDPTRGMNQCYGTSRGTEEAGSGGGCCCVFPIHHSSCSCRPQTLRYATCSLDTGNVVTYPTGTCPHVALAPVGAVTANMAIGHRARTQRHLRDGMRRSGDRRTDTRRHHVAGVP